MSTALQIRIAASLQNLHQTQVVEVVYKCHISVKTPVISIIKNKKRSMIQTSVMNFVRKRSRDSATSSNINPKFLPIHRAPRRYASEGLSDDSSVSRTDRQSPISAI